MTPAGTSNELDVQNGWEENTHTHNRAIQSFYATRIDSPKGGSMILINSVSVSVVMPFHILFWTSLFLFSRASMLINIIILLLVLRWVSPRYCTVDPNRLTLRNPLNTIKSFFVP